MKKIYFLISIFCGIVSFAQAPEKISFQALIKGSDDSVITNSQIGVQVSILKGSITGTSVYTEIHTPTTGASGVIYLEIGGGSVISGTFNTIQWGNDSYFLKLETDLSGGTNYTVYGTTQLLSVPYALHAKTAERVVGAGGKNTLVFTGDITNAQADSIIAKDLGPDTQYLRVSNTTNLTSLELPSFEGSFIGIDIQENESLTEINLPNIKNVLSYIYITSNPNLLNINLSGLQRTGEFVLAGGGESLNLNNLKKVRLFQIENSKVTAVSLPLLTAAGTIFIANNEHIQSLDLNNLTQVGGLSIDKNAVLSNVNCSTLTTAGDVSITDNIELTTVHFPLLQTAKGFTISYSKISSLNLQQIVSLYAVSVSYNSLLTSVNLTSLPSSSQLAINNNPLLSSINLSSYTLNTYSMSITNNQALIDVDISSLTSVPNFYMVGNSNLQNLNLNSLTTISSTEFNINNNKLSSATLNAIYARLVTLNLTGKIISSYGNAGQLTGQGLTDLQTLRDQGNTVMN